MTVRRIGPTRPTSLSDQIQKGFVFHRFALEQQIERPADQFPFGFAPLRSQGLQASILILRQ
jgi:hypothetical protein